MKVIGVIIIGCMFTSQVLASVDCAPMLRGYALDTVKEDLIDDWQHEKKIPRKNLVVEVSEPRKEKQTLTISGTTPYWMDIKISAGDYKYEFSRIYLLDKECRRNQRAELEWSKAAEQAIKKQK